jgi:hypothetical protein
MLEEQIRKIVELRHDAPYAILGPHYAERERALVIRAFLPQAERAYVLPADGTGRREMQRLHPDGLFAIPPAGRREAGLSVDDRRCQRSRPRRSTIPTPFTAVLHPRRWPSVPAGRAGMPCLPSWARIRR